jgi:carbamoyl-phosphate synthase small subunit
LSTPPSPHAPKPAELVLEDGTRFPGFSFGADGSRAGEVVFNTGMVGYPEALTDPSYRGQILALTYPLVGNYGVLPEELRSAYESQAIQATGLVVADYCEEFSHWSAARSLGDWLKAHGVPGLTGVDTRALTRRLRDRGTMLGKIVVGGADVAWYNPDRDHLVAQVSGGAPELHGDGRKLVTLVDCGCKANILRHLVDRGVRVRRVPWDHPFGEEEMDGLLLSNGPGDPVLCATTAANARKAIDRGVPTFGICLGHQMMALALGAKTYKLKFGHRGHNQPVRMEGTQRCFVTSQNHSFAVDPSTLPPEWDPLFTNLNDGTNEGLRHRSGRFFSAQFHPEAAPGPTDTTFLFDDFLKAVGA